MGTDPFIEKEHTFQELTSEKTGIEEMTLEEIKSAAEPKVKQDVWEWINGGTETGGYTSAQSPRT